MKKVLMFLLMVGVLAVGLMSCDKEGSDEGVNLGEEGAVVYMEQSTKLYPKWHSVVLYKSSDAAFKKDASWKNVGAYLYWGELLNWSDTMTKVSTNKKGKVITNAIIKVKRDLDDKNGYVVASQVVADPINVAVMLKDSMIYRDPTLRSGRKKTIIPPVLMYVVEVKDNKEGQWAKVITYNAPGKYNIDGKKTELWGCEWVKLNQLSLSESDATVISAIQISLSAMRKIDANDKKTGEQKADAHKKEREAIEQVIEAYPDSEAIEYARKAIEIIDPDAESSEGDEVLQADPHDDLVGGDAESTDSGSSTDTSSDDNLLDDEL